MTTPRRAAAALLAVRRRTWILVIVALALANAGVYLSAYGHCDRESDYCAVDVVGTRSEICVSWSDGYSIAWQTWPSSS